MYTSARDLRDGIQPSPSAPSGLLSPAAAASAHCATQGRPLPNNLAANQAVHTCKVAFILACLGGACAEAAAAQAAA